MDEIEHQTISASRNHSPLTHFSFNLLNLSITLHSSRLERLLKLLQFTINFDHPEFNFP
jgi:hypothetical protein